MSEERLFPAMQKSTKEIYDKGFNDAKNQVLAILKEAGDLGDGDYVWNAVNELGEEK